MTEKRVSRAQRLVGVTFAHRYGPGKVHGLSTPTKTFCNLQPYMKFMYGTSDEITCKRCNPSLKRGKHA